MILPQEKRNIKGGGRAETSGHAHAQNLPGRRCEQWAGLRVPIAPRYGCLKKEEQENADPERLEGNLALVREAPRRRGAHADRVPTEARGTAESPPCLRLS